MQRVGSTSVYGDNIIVIIVLCDRTIMFFRDLISGTAAVLTELTKLEELFWHLKTRKRLG